MRDVILDPYAEHSAAYTERTAVVFAEAVRVLNHATCVDHVRQGLPLASTAASVLAAMHPGAGGIAQLADQIGRAVTALHRDGRLEVQRSDYATADEAVATVLAELEQVKASARRMESAMQRAQNALGAVWTTGADEVLAAG